MSRPIRVVCGTRTARKEFSRRTPLGRSLSLVGRADAELQVFDRTSAGLPAIYNEAIQAAQRHPAILMFVHDDGHICDFFWAEKVRAAIKAFDIVGLAGN